MCNSGSSNSRYISHAPVFSMVCGSDVEPAISEAPSPVSTRAKTPQSLHCPALEEEAGLSRPKTASPRRASLPRGSPRRVSALRATATLYEYRALLHGENIKYGELKKGARPRKKVVEENINIQVAKTAFATQNAAHATTT